MNFQSSSSEVLAGWLAGWLGGWLAGWQAGWLVGRVAGCLLAALQCLYTNASSRVNCLVFGHCLVRGRANSRICAFGGVSCKPMWLEVARMR